MSNSTPVFCQQFTNIAMLSLRPFNSRQDLALIHQWVTQSHAQFWGMQEFTIAQLQQEYQSLLARSDIYIGYANNSACFLVELYEPQLDEIGNHYPVKAGDIGMHILIAQSNNKVHGFTWSVFQLVMNFIFANDKNQRVIVDPDIRNNKIHSLNTKAGFRYQSAVRLTHKTAHLAFCTRDDFYHALNKDNTTMKHIPLSPEQAVSHLTPKLWRHVNRLHVRKALSEFAHERLIKPQLTNEDAGWQYFELSTDKQNIVYRFKAKLGSLNHWHIAADSIEKQIDNQVAELDSIAFICELQHSLGISQAMLPTYLEEIASTLYGSAYKHQLPALTAEQLTSADFQQVESAMTEGHPCFIANNGRIGFDCNDYRQYAPETGAHLQLVWLAAHKDRIVFSTTDDLDYQTLITQELSTHTIEIFKQKLLQHGVNYDDYLLFPVHPWQWFNKLASLFSNDIAEQHLVCLGYSEDEYQPQQSIRTFFNKTHPHKRYVKTALSILNMGFMRGLSPYYMSATPAINDWVAQVVSQDPYLADSGFTILREVAAIGYYNHALEAATDQYSPYRKMLSALWRESPMPNLKINQRLMTMASLLHIDNQGHALLPALIKSAQIDTHTWITKYLKAYLDPLLHCFYSHDLVFMPHGENLILLLEDNIPVKAIMKDIAEEIAILNKDLVLADNIQRLTVDVPYELKILSIFTDVFDCFFRFVADILDQQNDYSERDFWQQVAECVISYQQSHPELKEKFTKYDLFSVDFTLSCLNRLQLSNNQQMIDLADPAKNLKFVGKLINPIAEFNPVRKDNSVTV